jgi:hypothetical protein
MLNSKLKIACTVFWLVYIVLLIVIPASYPPDPTLPNVAARSGYSTGLAYFLIAGWSVFGLLFFMLIPDQSEVSKSSNPGQLSNNPVRPTQAWLEVLIVGTLTTLLYWPDFLARFGNYIEDTYFMNVLARMQCGQLPYQDFEFLYGPLMIYPAHLWINLFGFSMHSYYTLIAFLQTACFILLLRLFQHHIHNFRDRFIAFLLFAPFVFDTLLGLNYIGWRLIPIILAILVVSAQPHSVLKALIAGTLIGIQLAYSYEFGIIAFIAISLLYVACFLEPKKPPVVYPALVFILTTGVIGFAITYILTGETLKDYLSATAYTLQYAKSTGIGNFRYYWTVNTLSLFGLLSIAVAIVGLGLRYLRHKAMAYGDRLILVALLFTLGSLRIAIQRADLWHVTLSFLPLILAFLWPTPKNIFTVKRSTQRMIVALIAVASITRLFGLLPTASYFGEGLILGAKNVLLEQGAGQSEVKARTYSVQSELVQPDKDTVSLANHLAQPTQTDRPVIFYSKLWRLGTHAGVCSSGYSFYKSMYTDGYKPMAEFLNDHHNTLVIIDEKAYGYLYENLQPRSAPAELSIVKKLASWVSSVHYQQKFSAKAVTREIWKRNLGDYLVENYQRAEQFGEIIVLERR